MMMKNTTRAVGTLLLAGALLGGCAGIGNVASDVSSFGDWPAERRPGTFAFERLPSQQAQARQSERLESAALDALQKAGFQPAAAGAPPDVLVQVGSRLNRSDRGAWDDPLWWRGGFGSWRYGGYGGWGGPSWSLGWHGSVPRYEREVALLIRDRSSGKPLFETRAASEGSSSLSGPLLEAMFEAALMDFPRTGVNPRRVVVALPGA